MVGSAILDSRDTSDKRNVTTFTRDSNRAEGGDGLGPSANTNTFLLGALCIALGTCLTVVFFPGFMSFDSIRQYQQAIGEIPLTDAHPPVMTVLWRVLLSAWNDPGVLLAAHQAAYWLSLFLFAMALMKAPLGRIAIILFVGLWPPLLIHSLHLWKDVGLLIAYMLVVACVLADIRRPSAAWLLLATVAFAYGTAVRHNAVFAAIPLSILIAERAAVRLSTSRTRYFFTTVGASAGLLLVAIMLNSIVSGSAENIDGLGTILVWDMVAVSLAEGRDLLPTYLPRLVEGDLLPALAATFDPHANYRSYDVIAPYPPEGMTGQLVSDWLTMIIQNPGAYLEHRIVVFSALMGIGQEVYYPFHYLGIDNNEFGITFSNLSAEQQGWFIDAFWCVSRLMLYPAVVYLFLSSILFVGLVIRWALEGSLPSLLWTAFWLTASGLVMTLPLFVIAPAADYRFIIWLVASTVLATVLVVVYAFKSRLDYL